MIGGFNKKTSEEFKKKVEEFGGSVSGNKSKSAKVAAVISTKGIILSSHVM
jgi:hypothetical protein